MTRALLVLRRDGRPLKGGQLGRLRAGRNPHRVQGAPQNPRPKFPAVGAL